MDRVAPSQGVHDPLYLRSIYLFDSEANEHVFLVSYDLLGTPIEWRGWLEEEVAIELGLEHPHVVLTVTHTHAGPDVLQVAIEAQQDYVTDVLRKTVEACCAAYQSRVRCDGSELVRTTVEDVGCIRRLGKAVSVPLTLQLFYPEQDDANPCVVLVHFACHPTILSAENLLYSAEYPGVVVSEMKRLFGNQTTVCFLNGACGDISTRFTRKEQSFDEVERLGKQVASGAVRALHQSDKVTSATVCMRLQEQSVILQPVSPDLELVAKLQSQLETASQTCSDDDASARIRHTQMQAIQVLQARAMAEAEPTAITLTAISFPGLASYVFWPGEPFSGYGEALSQQGEAATLLVGYAGYIGYLPDVTPEVDPAYEVMMSQYGSAGGQTLVRHSIQLLNLLN